MNPIQMENSSERCTRIENEDEVTITIKKIINKGYIFSFGASFGSCIFLWQRIQQPMTSKVKFSFNLQSLFQLDIFDVCY
jgi:hypothetical protein